MVYLILTFLLIGQGAESLQLLTAKGVSRPERFGPNDQVSLRGRKVKYRYPLSYFFGS